MEVDDPPLMSFAVFLVYVVCTYLRPFDLWFPQLAAYRPMLILWLVAFMLALGGALRERKVAGAGLHFGLMFLLVVAIALSSLVRDGAGAAAFAVAQFSASLMLMLLALLNLTSYRRLRLTCGVIAVSLVTLALMSIASFHTGWLAEHLVLRQSTYREVEAPDLEFLAAPADDDSGLYIWRVRSLGFLNDPNDFAQAMVAALPLLWMNVRHARWLLNLFTFALPAMALLYATYLTHSRGAVVALGVVILLGLRRVIGPVRTGVFVGVALAALVATSFGGGRGFTSQEESAADRIEAWWTGLNLLRSYPVFGAGFDNFTDHHHLTAHNSFVLCFAELGVLGLFAWVGLLVVAYLGLARAARVTDGAEDTGVPSARLAELLRSSLLGFLAAAWFLSRTYQPGLYLLLALCIAAWSCTNEEVLRRGGKALTLASWAPATVAAMAASIAGVYAFVWLHRLGGP